MFSHKEYPDAKGYSSEEMEDIKNGISSRLSYSKIATLLEDNFGKDRSANGIRKHVGRNRSYYEGSRVDNTSSNLDRNLLLYAESDSEKEQLNAVLLYGSTTKASEQLGLSRGTIGGAIARVRARAEKRGYNPSFNMTNNVAPGHHVKKTATLYDGDGIVKQQWVTTDKDKEELFDKLKEAVEAVIEPSRGIAKPTKQPTDTISDLMVCYPVADTHLGMYAWAEESGDDFDAEICENILVSAMMELVESTPRTETCLIANLADYFHTDTSENRTLRSGNILDVDTRWGKVFQIGVRAYKRVIELALEKHQKVVVKSGVGNHDDHSIFCLAMIMKAYFENEPRVEVDLPINPFAYHVFGKNLIGIHHGGLKIDRYPLIMATDMAEAWGKTSYRTFLTGHLHHKKLQEFPGCTVEIFQSISPKDSWTHRSGYRSGRSMVAIVYQKEGGEHGRRVVNI